MDHPIDGQTIPAAESNNAYKLGNWLPWLVLAVLAGVGMALVLPFDKLFTLQQPPDPALIFVSSLGTSLAVILMLLHHRNWPLPRFWEVLLFWGALGAYGYYVFDQPPSEVWTLVQLHVGLPFLFVLGLAYLPGDWLDIKSWKAFVRFYGEYAAFGFLAVLGVVMVAVLGVTLFGQLRLGANAYWYAFFIGLALIQVWSAWVALHFGQWGMAPKAARVLAPLAGLLFAAYLVCRLVFRLSMELSMLDPHLVPFMHTVALMVALGLAVYCVVSLAEKNNRLIAAALAVLLGVALGTNVPVISQLFSLASGPAFGAGTLILLGGNLVITGHLLLLLGGVLGSFLKVADMDVVEGLTVRYLPVYLVWSLFVLLVVPLIF